MTGVLEDYDTARQAAVTAVLEMLTAEAQLSEPGSDVTAVLGDDREIDVAARTLAEATEALPWDRRPAGWSEPPAVSGVPEVARTRFVRAAIRVLAARYADESADADAESEYAEERMALAARNLTADLAARGRAS